MSWTDHSPDDLVPAHLTCRDALYDEPTGEPAMPRRSMTVAELRQLEDARIDYGQRRHSIADLVGRG